LQNAGYKIYPNLYKFEDYGIPQNRHRIILIGVRNDINTVFKIPKQTFNYMSSQIALDNIPSNALNNELIKQSPLVIQRLQAIRPGENAWCDSVENNPALKLNVKGAKLSNIYKKLDPTKPAYTVTGSGGGGTYMYHWAENRALTNRERARLQTFPDNYLFLGNKDSVRKQIGMAVPPFGAKIIFTALINSIASIEYDAVETNIINFS